jgi:hypothetical protein
MRHEMVSASGLVVNQVRMLVNGGAFNAIGAVDK